MTTPDRQSRATDAWASMSPAEQALAVGIYGPPELKRDEKLHHLGEFRERVIRLLTKAQVAEPTIYSEIVEALKDERAVKLLINGDLADYFTRKYEKLADGLCKPSTVLRNPELRGNVGLAVVADDAVDVEEIAVMDRKERLGRLGLPEPLVDAVGGKVCSRCLEKIEQADPNETVNYQRMVWADRLFGISCKACTRRS